MSAELVNLLASQYIIHEDVDIRESSLTLLSFILSIDRPFFNKEDVLSSFKDTLPKIISYSMQDEIPEEIRSAVAVILRYVQ